MKTSLLLAVAIVALLAVAGQAFAGGCSMPGMSHGAGAGGTTPASAASSPPPVENQLQITGTVVSVEPNGAALVDIGTAKVYVLARLAPTADGTPGTSPFKVGERVQVAGVLMALSVQPAPEQGQAAPVNTPLKQARFKVSNILCGMCSQSVQAALQATAGVTQVVVTEAGIATVTYDPAKTTVEALVKAITHAKHTHGMVFKATLQQ